MPMLRRINCDLECCNEEYEEPEYGLGFPGWLLINGLSEHQIALCPKHGTEVANTLNRIEEE